MNYEEKYKEALERAKKFEEKYGGDYAGYIFPELAESEDERIRKELVEAFEALDIDSSWNGIPVKSILAWLEKQKEQKPAEIPPYVTGIKGHPDPAGVWKPSEEQMEAFKKYIEEFHARAEAAVGGWNNFDVMIRLYEQLKKL